MPERMTMVQLARLASLDVSTVSRALRGDTRRVSASTIERVQQLARRMEFLPDANAASLRSRRSYAIGMLVPDLTDVVLANLFEAVSTAANTEGYSTIVSSTRVDRDRRRASVHDFLARRVDGVIVADATLRHAVPDALVVSGTPFVMALRSGGRHPCVVVDDVVGGRLAAEHLIDAGHRTLCVIGGPRNISTVKGRISGFVQTCRRAGSTPAPAVRYGDFGVEGGYRSMCELLGDGLRPTGIFAVNDYNAIGASRALQEHGAVVGRDVALVGYNDISIGPYLQTPLTTVRVDHGVMGREVVRLLFGLVGGQEPRSVKIRPELVVRASSGLAGRPSGDAQPRSRDRLANSPRSS